MIISVVDLLETIRVKLHQVILIAVAIFLMVALLVFFLPREYSSTSSLLIDIAQTDPTDESSIKSQSVTETVMNTEINVIQSALVVGEVALRSGLATKTGTAEEREESLQKAMREIRNRMSLASDRQSNVLRISYRASTAEDAARIANMIADVFLEKQVEVRGGRARSTASWYDERVAEARKKYSDAQQRLTDFQTKHGIVGLDRLDVESEKLKGLAAEMAMAEAAAATAHSKAGAVNMPEVAAADAVQGLEQRRAVAAARVSELAKTLGPNHPDMVAAQAELSALSSALSSARSNQASALAGASVAASRRLAGLRQQMAQEQEKMIRVGGLQDQLMVLQRDVDVAQKSYEETRSRLDSARLKSEIAQTNASPLDRAIVPIIPSKPRVFLMLLAGMLLGGLAGIGSALLPQILKPRVRTASGLASSTEVDVIADLSSFYSNTKPSFTFFKQGV